MVLSFEGFSQHSFGIEFGQVNQRQFGTHQFDSIVVIPSGNETLNTRFLGLFFEMELSDKFALHTKLTHSRAFTRYLYYNENNEVFPGIFERKVSGPSVTRVSWEILPQFSLVKFGKMEMNVFGGVNISANIVKDDAELAFRGLPGVSKVGNAFRTSQLPITLNFALGGSIEYARRIVFWTKWQPTSFYSRDIVIDGERYPFENRWNFFTTTIGYKFYSLRFKKKDGI
jgi:hypothetical protein